MKEPEVLKDVTPRAQVFVGIPSYGNQIHEGILGAFVKASENQVASVCCASYSILTRNFNILLCGALNMRNVGVTHFLLWHADIVPTTDFFIDKMLDLMNKKQADVLSVIIPIKEKTGFTSTAMETDDPWTFKRLTMTEVFDKRCNATFTDPKLVVNSGLMLVDLRKPWVENICFDFEERIYRDENGTFKAGGVSEDWLFSRRAKALGAKLYATREIQAVHMGAHGFTNYAAWGTKAHDS